MTTSPQMQTDRRESALDLVEATRELMLAAATTDVDDEQLRAAARQLRDLTDVLASRRRPRALRAAFEGPALARAEGDHVGWRLFAHQPAAFPIEMHFGQDDARATVVASALFEGPPETLHGGFVAHILDCMLGTLMQARGVRALTASLEVDYLGRTPLDVPLELFSRIVRIDGRKTTAEGWIEHDGVRTAVARGLFIALKEES